MNRRDRMMMSALNMTGLRLTVGLLMGFFSILQIGVRSAQSPGQQKLYIWQVFTAMSGSSEVRHQVLVGALYLVSMLLCLGGIRPRGFIPYGAASWVIASAILLYLHHNIVGWVPVAAAITILVWEWVLSRQQRSTFEHAALEGEPEYPSRVSRAALWVVFNVLIFFAVAITNGFIVFFIGVVSSCLLSAWMITAFLVRPGAPNKPLSLPLKIILVALGTLALVGFTYGNPIYLATILAVVIHEMRVLNRYEFGPVTAICAPVISMLPLVPTSHASYSQLVLFPQAEQFEPFIGYVIITTLFVVTALLIKRDDRDLLPLVGKTERQFAFEAVGTPKWMRRRFGFSG